MEGVQMSEPIYFSTNSHPISNPTTQIMRVDLDGGFTVNESIPATDAAKMVLGLMKQEWLADAQSIKIRDQQEYIKQLEEDLMDAKNKHAALVADVALYEDRGERIKRLEDIIHRASCEFFRDGSDIQVANGMLTILEEVRKP